jgi:hypothetical protein
MRNQPNFTPIFQPSLPRFAPSTTTSSSILSSQVSAMSTTTTTPGMDNGNKDRGNIITNTEREVNSINSCKYCRSSHRKCDRKLPSCSQCIKRKIQCLYEPTKKRKTNFLTNIQTNAYAMTSQENQMQAKKRRPNQEVVNVQNGELIFNENQVQFIANHQNNVVTEDAIVANQVLDACFTLFKPNGLGDDFQQGIIAQYLWHKATPDLSGIGNKNERLNQSANQALWFALQAVALQQLPSSEQSPYFSNIQEQQIYERISYKLTTFTGGLVKMRTDADLKQIVCKFPRFRLQQAAKQMFNNARDILLDPQVFPHIGTHLKLAQACSYLTFFLMVSGERSEEAEVFLNSAKVYLDRAQSILDLNLDSYSDSVRKELEMQQETVERLMRSYSAMKSMLWYNFAPRTKDFYTKKSLHKFIKLSIRAITIGKHSPPDLKCSMAGPLEFLKKLKSIVDEVSSSQPNELLSQLNRFLQVSKDLRYELTRCVVDGGYFSIWKLFSFSYEIFAIEIATIEATQTNDSSSLEMLSTFQVNIAHEFTRECFQNLPIVVTIGARFLALFKFACRILIEQSVRLCNSNPPNFKELSNSLSSLNSMMIILDSVDKKFDVIQFREMFDQVKSQYQFHKQYMDKSISDNVTLVQNFSTLPSNHANMTRVIANNNRHNSPIENGNKPAATDSVSGEVVDNFFHNLYETFHHPDVKVEANSPYGRQTTEENKLSPDLTEETSNFFLEYFNIQGSNSTKNN